MQPTALPRCIYFVLQDKCKRQKKNVRDFLHKTLPYDSLAYKRRYVSLTYKLHLARVNRLISSSPLGFLFATNIEFIAPLSRRHYRE